jgi:hypothetical protein
MMGAIFWFSRRTMARKISGLNVRKDLVSATHGP